MKLIKFDSRTCEQVQSYLDSYLNDELLVETNHDIQKHVGNCRECSAELEARGRLRSALQRAVGSEPVPDVLAARIREQVRAGKPIYMFPLTSTRLGVAAALVVVFCLGTWGALSAWKHDRASTRIVQAGSNPLLSEPARRILNIGLSDHVHCAIENEEASKYIGKLEAEYADLVPLVKEKLGKDYEVVAAHHCEVDGREFVHFVLKSEDATLSLALTKKNGESFPSEDRTMISHESGVSLYQGHSVDYRIAGFEAGSHLAFVISDLRREENLRITSVLVRPVRDQLARSGTVAQL